MQSHFQRKSQFWSRDIELRKSALRCDVEENNGHVEVKSEVGKGSEFVVYFKSAQLSVSANKTGSS